MNPTEKGEKGEASPAQQKKKKGLHRLLKEKKKKKRACNNAGGGKKDKNASLGIALITGERRRKIATPGNRAKVTTKKKRGIPPR